MYLDNDVGDLLLLAESGQPNNELDGINVVRNDHKLGLALLNETSHILQTKLDKQGLVLLHSFAIQASLGLGEQTLLLVGTGFGLVFVEQAKELTGVVLLQRMTELVDGRRHFDAVQKNLFLALKLDVARPLDKAIEVHRSLGTQSTANTKHLGARLEQGVLGRLALASNFLGSGSLALVGSDGRFLGGLLSGLREGR